MAKNKGNLTAQHNHLIYPTHLSPNRLPCRWRFYSGHFITESSGYHTEIDIPKTQQALPFQKHMWTLHIKHNISSSLTKMHNLPTMAQAHWIQHLFFPFLLLWQYSSTQMTTIPTTFPLGITTHVQTIETWPPKSSTAEVNTQNPVVILRIIQKIWELEPLFHYYQWKPQDARYTYPLSFMRYTAHIVHKWFEKFKAKNPESVSPRILARTMMQERSMKLQRNLHNNNLR